MKDHKGILPSSASIYLITNLVGLVGFFYPFFLPMLVTDKGQMASPWADDAARRLCFVALLLEVQGMRLMPGLSRCWACWWH
jgi:hypothetical protein